jgi:hypothetical protein
MNPTKVVKHRPRLSFASIALVEAFLIILGSGCRGLVISPEEVLGLVISPEEVTLPALEPGERFTRWIRIWNSSSGPIVFSVAEALPAPFRLGDSSTSGATARVPVCAPGLEIPAKSSCQIAIEFQPSAAGKFEAELEIQYADSNGEAGTALAPIHGSSRSFCVRRTR